MMTQEVREFWANAQPAPAQPVSAQPAPSPPPTAAVEVVQQ